MRILSGMKPTGYLHLGNYVGALKNWVELQNKYECYFMIADLHSLTSNQSMYKTETNDYIFNMVVDWIAAGLDSQRSVLFKQSDVPEHSELNTLLAMITPVSWLERNPTFKELKDELTGKDLDNLGFLGYPVLQAADIALYEAERVPVGKDQLPHLEIAREIIRRFHHIYQTNTLPEPEPILGEVTKLNGIDGRKMSKSYNNAIYLKDDEQTVYQKIMNMVTDTARVRRNDPGHPDNCNLFPYYQAFAQDQSLIDSVRHDCSNAKIGCVDCKKQLSGVLSDYFENFRKRRQELVDDPQQIETILYNGAVSASKTASATMRKVREAIGMSSKIRYAGYD